MEQTPTLAHLIKQAIDNRLLDVHTALIAVVESYDAEKQQVDVTPVLKRCLRSLSGDWVDEELPKICDVPILFPRAGSFFISFPIQPGDFVQLIFNEVCIDDWLDDTPSTMSRNERFSLQGAVALPGIYPSTKTITDVHKTNLVLGREQGPQIHIDGKKIMMGSDKADEALAIASKVKEELDRIKSAFNNHSHMSSSGPIKPTNKIIASSDIATKKMVAQ